MLKSDVFFGKRGVVECGPPNFSKWTAVWFRDDIEIKTDSNHNIINNNNSSELTIENFLQTDTGKKNTTWSLWLKINMPNVL